jgi:hypothetical protein
VNHLQNGGVNLNDATVDDGAADARYGGFDADWFLANWDDGVRDVIGDASRRGSTTRSADSAQRSAGRRPPPSRTTSEPTAGE